jgi:hypothetical protein
LRMMWIGQVQMKAQVLMVISLGSGGTYFWKAAGQEYELIDPVNRKALVSLKCHNPTNIPVRIQVIRTETGAIEFEDNLLLFPEWRPLGPPVERPQLPEPEFELDEIHQACEYLQSTKPPG